MSMPRRPRLTLRRRLMLFAVVTLVLITAAGLATLGAVERQNAATHVLVTEIEPSRRLLEAYQEQVLTLDVQEDRGGVSDQSLRITARSVLAAGDQFAGSVDQLPGAASGARALADTVDAWLGVSALAGKSSSTRPLHTGHLEDAQVLFERLRGTLATEYSRLQEEEQDAFETLTTVLIVDFVAAVAAAIGLTAFALLSVDRPLRRLQKDVASVAAGDVRPLHGGRLPELAALADATDQMREQVSSASAAAAGAEVRSRTAFLLNDGVLQALAAATMALELDERDAAGALLAEATAKARTAISALLPEGGLQPGGLLRDSPALLDTIIEPRLACDRS